MQEWFSFIACVDKVHHVADVVNIAIGVNLLLPVASSFLKCFLDGLEIEPGKIVEEHFRNVDVTPGEIEEIAVVAQAIEVEKAKCNPLAWRWWILDSLAACAGIVLLLTGWVDKIGLWCLFLFLPSCLAIGLSVRKYVKLRRNFLGIIARVKEQSATRKKTASSYVKNYVKKCNATIKKKTGKRNVA